MEIIYTILKYTLTPIRLLGKIQEIRNFPLIISQIRVGMKMRQVWAL